MSDSGETAAQDSDVDLWMPNRDTAICLSLSGRPSNIGTRFHNYLYRHLGLNYFYRSFTTDDLPAAVAGIRALGIRGFAVSMPFKEKVIELVDEMDPSARAIDSVNTVVNNDGMLHAYNTDFSAVRSLLASHQVNNDSPAVVRGAGGMAKAVVAAMRDYGFDDVTVVARNAAAGAQLAGAYGYRSSTEAPSTSELLVNVTPIGMADGPNEGELSFDESLITAATTVFDVVAFPSETPLIVAARNKGIPVITGAEVIALQAAEQFALYTGITPDADLVRAASEYSRQ